VRCVSGSRSVPVNFLNSSSVPTCAWPWLFCLPCFAFLLSSPQVCNTLEGAFNTASNFKAIPPFPPNNVTQVQDTCVKQSDGSSRCYDDSIHFNNFTMQVQNSDPEVGRSFPGYVLYMENVTRVCNHYITEQCLAAYGQVSGCCAAVLCYTGQRSWLGVLLLD
jgi:hypothetical protein